MKFPMNVNTFERKAPLSRIDNRACLTEMLLKTTLVITQTALNTTWALVTENSQSGHDKGDSFCDIQASGLVVACLSESVQHSY